MVSDLPYSLTSRVLADASPVLQRDVKVSLALCSIEERRVSEHHVTYRDIPQDVEHRRQASVTSLGRVEQSRDSHQEKLERGALYGLHHPGFDRLGLLHGRRGGGLSESQSASPLGGVKIKNGNQLANVEYLLPDG